MAFLPRWIWPLAAGLALSLAAATHAAIFSIADFGAKADDATPVTDAFRQAIAAARTAGGGTVEVPAGRYVSGPIELCSNLTLRLDPGSVVRFPAQRLPFTRGREQGIECLTPVPLVGGHDLENVTITGEGVLTTNNADWLKLMSRTRAHGSDPGTAFGAAWERLLHDLQRHTPAPEADYRAAAPELRPSFVRFMNSRYVRINGVRFGGSPMWTVHLLYCQNATVDGVIIETYPGVHTDGIGIDSSRFVRISNCYIDTGDDGIVVKSGKDADGLRVNRPSEDIVITNCTIHRAHGAVTLGSETSGWIRNLAASNIVCDGTEAGIRIKSRRGRGGGVEDVRFDNWTLQHVGTAIDITSFYLMEGEVPSAPAPVSRTTPVFRDIAISHITVNDAKVVANIQGLPEMPIERLRLIDIIGHGPIRLQACSDAVIRDCGPVQTVPADAPVSRTGAAPDDGAR